MAAATWARWGKDFGFTIALLLVFQVGVAQPFHVPTGSMEVTVLPGDRVLVDKVTLGPRTPDWLGVPFTGLGRTVPAIKLPGLRRVRAGDIVVVRTPVSPRIPYFKRVVATGGQVVELRDKALYVDGILQADPPGALHRDARVLPRGLAVRGISPALGNRDNWGPFQVQPGCVFLMGDNRDESLDSRFFGAVPEEQIIGLARFVYFSWDRETSGLPPWRRCRWDRLGRPLA